MPFYNNFLGNGSSVTLPHSANFDDWAFENVAEVQINTATFSAEYGVGGAVFNEISKSGTNGYSNNWTGVLESSYPFPRYFGRLDYNLSDKNRLTFSIHEGNFTFYAPQPYTWGNQAGDTDMYQAQIPDVYSISPNTVNEFRFGFTREGNWYVPASLDKNYPQNLGWSYAEANLPPSLQFYGNPGLSWPGPAVSAQYVENVFDTSDVVTMIRGRHILKFGGELLDDQDNDTPWGNINSGTFLFSGVFTQQAPNSSGGLGYADFLGQVASWNAGLHTEHQFPRENPAIFHSGRFQRCTTLDRKLWAAVSDPAGLA